MRILVINSEYPPIGGGAGNASAYISRELIEMDHEVCVMTARYGELPYYEQEQGVRVHRVPALRRRLDRSGALEQISFILGACLWGLRICRNYRPDVILAFFGTPSGVVALWFHMLFKIPYVVSLRGGDVPGFRPYDFARYHRMIAPLLRIVWQRASAIVANSAGLRKLALAFDDDSDISIVPNGVDISRFAPTKRAWEPAHLLFVGRLVHQKGLDLLLNALHDLRELKWELTIVGDGVLRDDLHASVDQFNITERVHFVGWQRDDDLVRHYRRANLFVLPSRHEGMPNVILEAMACGLPVIASNIPGNEELVLYETTGLLVPSEDIASLRSALRVLIQDPEQRKLYGEASHRRVIANYTWRMTAEGYMQIFKQIGESN